MQLPIKDISDPNWQWKQLTSGLSASDAMALEPAFRFASEVHSDQWRKTAEGEPKIRYMVHPVRVARILLEEWGCRDRKILATALLHDVLEDGDSNKREEYSQKITEIAGAEALNAVVALSKFPLPTSVTEEIKTQRDANYFRNLRASEEWVRLVKCADRADNLRDAKNWGELQFWQKYSSETIGWHLQLARETSPIAEVALFKALVDGERLLNGKAPVWADGNLIDKHAAAAIPEHIARNYHVVGIALQGKTLIVGLSNLDSVSAVTVAIQASNASVHSILPLKVSQEAIEDALEAGLFGSV